MKFRSSLMIRWGKIEGEKDYNEMMMIYVVIVKRRWKIFYVKQGDDPHKRWMRKNGKNENIT